MIKYFKGAIVKLRYLLPIFLLSFSNLFCMHKGDLDQEGEDGESKAIVCSQHYEPKSLFKIAAYYVSHKLKEDAKAGRDYKEFLNPKKLNEDIKSFLISHLTENNSSLLWKSFKHSIEHFELPIWEQDQMDDKEVIASLSLCGKDRVIIVRKIPMGVYERSEFKVDFEIAVWDINSKERLLRFDTPQFKFIKLSKDYTKLFAFADDIKVYDLESGNLIDQKGWDRKFPVIKSALFKDDQIYIGFRSGEIKILKIDNLEELFSFQCENVASISNMTVLKNNIIVVHDDENECVCFFERLDGKDSSAQMKENLVSDVSSVHFTTKHACLKKVSTAYLVGILSFSSLKSSWFEVDSCGSCSAISSKDEKLFLLGERIDGAPRHSSTFLGLAILEAKTGKQFRKFNFKKEFGIDNFNGFGISDDNSFILFYRTTGLFVKVSLDLGKTLEEILEGIANPCMPEPEILCQEIQEPEMLEEKKVSSSCLVS